MPPEDVIDLLNEHMTALTEIVHRHHGVVDKFVGDLIMAIFGAPKSYGDDAGNAAACAEDCKPQLLGRPMATPEPAVTKGMPFSAGPSIVQARILLSLLAEIM